MNPLKNEPVMLTYFVAAAIALAVAFGVDISQSQQDSILAFVAACLPIFAFVRQMVYSPATVEREVMEAANTGVVPENLQPPAGSVG